MAFEGLSDRLDNAFKKLKSKGSLTESDVRDAMREVRLALLEADVNYKVAKDFTNTVTERAIGAKVMESLTPAQMVIKIVNEELTALMGGTQARLSTAAHPPTVVMMCGLQGSGKTTHSAKIALRLKEQGHRPLLVACDIYRPAAIEQLQTLGRQIGVPVFSKGTNEKAEVIAAEAMQYARDNQHDLIIVDTAGRLHVDDALMEELQRVEAAIKPTEILLVVDSLTGQDIVNVAKTFSEKIHLTGAVLTKMDGDARGGGALSIRKITNVPIKFVATGEKLEAIDLFYPDRMADRILGMGDVMSLIEKAQDVIDEKSAKKSIQRMQDGTFGLDDMLESMRQVQKLGPLSGIMKMLPGMPANMPNINDEAAGKQLKKTEAIILSMTPEERRNPDIIKASRKERIANPRE